MMIVSYSFHSHTIYLTFISGPVHVIYSGIVSSSHSYRKIFKNGNLPFYQINLIFDVSQFSQFFHINKFRVEKCPFQTIFLSFIENCSHL